MGLPFLFKHPPETPVTPLMNSAATATRLRDVVSPVCEARGLWLVDARMTQAGGAVLRVLVERPGSDPQTGAGVTLEDCQALSRELSDLLDDPPSGVSLPKGGYRLEVGSPGVERPLFALADYGRFAGRDAKIQCNRPVGGQRRFAGTLAGVDGEDILLEQDDERIRIPYSEVAKAHLVYRF